MSRIKCSKCSKLAHTVIDGKTYCMDCIPKPTMPVVIEETVVNEVVIEKMKRPKPWPAPEPLGGGYFKVPTQIVQKKSWWTKIIEFFDDRRPK
jgi:hypothetical protein